MEKTVIKLDDIPAGVPNPPPWQVLYHNDSEKDRRDVLPEAYTDGLIKLGVPELLIRKAPPGIAAAILDRFGAYLIFQKGSLTEGMRLEYMGTLYTVALTVKEGKPTYRLAWSRDPNGGETSKDFQMAMSLFKLKGA